MKQHSLVFIVFLLSTFTLLSSCQKTSVNKGKSSKPNVETLALTSPSYASNPYDGAGYWHNEAMDYLGANISTSETIEGLIGHLMDYMITYPSAPYLIYSIDVPAASEQLENLEFRIAETDFDNTGSYDLVFELLGDIESEDFEDEEYDDFKTLIVTWEDNVSGSAMISSSDKQKLLHFSSVLRWSGYYWTENDVTVWPTVNHPHPVVSGKWWQIAGADALGGLAGFIGGGGPGGAVVVGAYASMGLAAIIADKQWHYEQGEWIYTP